MNGYIDAPWDFEWDDEDVLISDGYKTMSVPRKVFDPFAATMIVIPKLKNLITELANEKADLLAEVQRLTIAAVLECDHAETTEVFARWLAAKVLACAKCRVMIDRTTGKPVQQHGIDVKA